ncbi:MAG TPA: hypothetical protein VFX48_03250 [Saprospiraceae bacterium]|nr:hypothetical protein [Saprospiraceae bacterium]
MKTIMVSIFTALWLTASLAADANPIHLTGLNAKPCQGICFRTAATSLVQDPELPTDQIRFISEDAPFRFSFSGEALFLQLDSPNRNSPSAPSILKESGSSSTLGLFFEGIHPASQLIAAEGPKTNASQENDWSDTPEACPYQYIYYTEIYPGIDLRFGDREEQLQFDYLIQPGFDHREIRIRVEGATDMYVDANGQLFIQTGSGSISQDPPAVRQGEQSLKANWKLSANTISVEIQDANPDLPLQIQSMFKWAVNH